MNLYDKASLIITPNAYKAGKIYAAKPTSGAGDLTFSRASAQTRRNSAGVIENLANNVPALDYLVVGGCPWWNFPVARTNNLLWSENFSNATWSKVTTTVNADTSVAPDGSTTADSLLFNAGNSSAYQAVSSGLIGLTSYTFSIYLKLKSGTPSSDSDLRVAVFGDRTGSPLDIGSTINSFWQRFSVTVVTTASPTNLNAQIVCDTIGVEIEAWGAQLELGAYASPYMPTTTATVTRVLANPNTSGLTSFIGQAEGSWYTEIRTDNILNTASGDVISISSSVFVGTIAGTIRCYIFHSTGFILLSNFAMAANTTYKIAFRYKSGDSVVCINGTPFTSAVNFTFATALNSLDYPSNSTLGPRSVQLFGTNIFFKEPLTNAELLALTI